MRGKKKKRNARLADMQVGCSKMQYLKVKKEGSERPGFDKRVDYSGYPYTFHLSNPCPD